ncbi:MAG: hypothetical protein HF976_10235 [ANME-2 cluster archaeon]|nr:hypothetical protein [ANME-2 cluster archaeon]MBC2706264.1 hypothetical protein [ANME-2 cluster archaeon]MBC2746416.1 hypothetical protein [ANME-2 cluster archaeon]
MLKLYESIHKNTFIRTSIHRSLLKLSQPYNTSPTQFSSKQFGGIKKMVMEELMLVNPTGSGRKRRRKQKPLQIIFPKTVRKLRANPEYIDRARTRSKALGGNLTGKHVAGSLGGAAATIAVPNAMRLRGWGDVISSVAVDIGGVIAEKQMDEGSAVFSCSLAWA